MGDVEKLHPWLFNIGVGLLFGLVAWYFFHYVWVILVVPFIWAYIRVAWIRSRQAP